MDQYPPQPGNRPENPALQMDAEAIGAILMDMEAQFGEAQQSEAEFVHDRMAVLSHDPDNLVKAEAEYSENRDPGATPVAPELSAEAAASAVRPADAINEEDVENFLAGLSGDAGHLSASDLEVVGSEEVFQNEDLAERRQIEQLSAQDNEVARSVAAVMLSNMLAREAGLQSSRNTDESNVDNSLAGRRKRREKEKKNRNTDRGSDDDRRLVAA